MQFAFVLIALCQFYYGAAESQVAVNYQRVKGKTNFILVNEMTSSIRQYCSPSNKNIPTILFQLHFHLQDDGPQRRKEEPCTFKGAQCPIEIIEHEFVYKYIQSSDVVLELGARHGTTTCAIACTLKNSGRVVAVEPDRSVWEYLRENVKAHSCASTIFFGAVSDVPLVVFEQSYGTRTFQTNATKEVITADSSHMMLYQLYNVMDMQFTVLLIDCEGCITHLLPDNLQRLVHLFQHVRTILLEGDMGTKAADCFKDCVDYEVWKRRFIDIGFVVIEETPDPAYTFINHYVFVRKNTSEQISPQLLSKLLI